MIEIINKVIKVSGMLSGTFFGEKLSVSRLQRLVDKR